MFNTRTAGLLEKSTLPLPPPKFTVNKIKDIPLGLGIKQQNSAIEKGLTNPSSLPHAGRTWILYIPALDCVLYTVCIIHCTLCCIVAIWLFSTMA